MRIFSLKQEGMRNFERLGRRLEALFQKARKKGLLDDTRTGFYYTVLVHSCDEPSILQGKVCEVSPEKEGKYRKFSQEKCVRLYGHPDHISSFESYDEAREMWPGGVRGGVGIESYCASISGLPWKWDESLILSALVMEGHITLSAAARIVAKSGNNTWPLALALAEDLGLKIAA